MVHLAKFPVGTAISGTAIVPVMPYRNPLAMVDWLCGAYGFQKRGIAKGKNIEFEHAELAFGDSMYMVVAAQNPTFDRLLVHPDQVGGVETHACYLVVPDIDAHYARAAASGAEIIYGIRAKESGGRGYASRDPEGHVWLFGTYDPFEHRQAHEHRRRRKLRLGVPALAAALLL